jgi:hypothetical protein
VKRSTILRLAAVLALGAGCDLDAPTKLAIVEEEPVSPPALANSPALFDLIGAIEDVRIRILPTLDAEAEAERLAAHLRDLTTHLLSGRVGQAEQSLGLARGILGDEGADGTAALGHPVDVGVIHLLLDRAEQVLLEEFR